MSGLFNIDEDFESVQLKVELLVKKHLKLKADYLFLQEEFNRINGQQKELERQRQELIEENKRIKLVSVISGNEDHKRLMKNHINRLVKEIDVCIVQMQNIGL